MSAQTKIQARLPCLLSYFSRFRDGILRPNFWVEFSTGELFGHKKRSFQNNLQQLQQYYQHNSVK